ncbi:hypothetical protein FGG78_23100 [Thioclava sp. BHET1]|nr:hypothetical protein FGG78_23100 [Thioclava sp. BHET1]
MTIGTATIPVALILFASAGPALGPVTTICAMVGGALGWLATLVLIDHPILAEISALRRMLRPAMRPPAE